MKKFSIGGEVATNLVSSNLSSVLAFISIINNLGKQFREIFLYRKFLYNLIKYFGLMEYRDSPNFKWFTREEIEDIIKRILDVRKTILKLKKARAEKIL